MNNYRKAQAIINKEFPDLRELKRGCDVEVVRKLFLRDIGDVSTVLYFKDGYVYISGDISGHHKEVFEGSRFKILGQPITMQSLLRYLEQRLKEGKFYQTYDDRLLFGGLFIYLQGWMDSGYFPELDISKPPQEWGEEKWGEILNIIQK